MIIINMIYRRHLSILHLSIIILFSSCVIYIFCVHFLPFVSFLIYSIHSVCLFVGWFFFSSSFKSSCVSFVTFFQHHHVYFVVHFVLLFWRGTHKSDHKKKNKRIFSLIIKLTSFYEQSEMQCYAMQCANSMLFRIFTLRQ